MTEKKRKPPKRPVQQKQIPAARVELFVNEFLTSFDASAAAKAALYSPKDLKSAGYRVLHSQQVQDEIRRRLEPYREEATIAHYRAMKELAALSFSDIRRLFDAEGNLLPIKEWPDDVAATVGSVKVKKTQAGDEGEETVFDIKLWDKNAAIQKFMQRYGFLVNKNEHTGAEGGPLEFLQLLNEIDDRNTGIGPSKSRAKDTPE